MILTKNPFVNCKWMLLELPFGSTTYFHFLVFLAQLMDWLCPTVIIDWLCPTVIIDGRSIAQFSCFQSKGSVTEPNMLSTFYHTITWVTLL